MTKVGASRMVVRRFFADVAELEAFAWALCQQRRSGGPGRSECVPLALAINYKLAEPDAGPRPIYLEFATRFIESDALPDETSAALAALSGDGGTGGTWRFRKIAS